MYGLIWSFKYAYQPVAIVIICDERLPWGRSEANERCFALKSVSMTVEASVEPGREVGRARSLSLFDDSLILIVAVLSG